MAVVLLLLLASARALWRLALKEEGDRVGAHQLEVVLAELDDAQGIGALGIAHYEAVLPEELPGAEAVFGVPVVEREEVLHELPLGLEGRGELYPRGHLAPLPCAEEAIGSAGLGRCFALLFRLCRGATAGAEC